jgi:hypothetical protein
MRGVALAIMCVAWILGVPRQDGKLVQPQGVDAIIGAVLFFGTNICIVFGW